MLPGVSVLQLFCYQPQWLRSLTSNSHDAGRGAVLFRQSTPSTRGAYCTARPCTTAAIPCAMEPPSSSCDALQWPPFPRPAGAEGNLTPKPRTRVGFWGGDFGDIAAVADGGRPVSDRYLFCSKVLAASVRFATTRASQRCLQRPPWRWRSRKHGREGLHSRRRRGSRQPPRCWLRKRELRTGATNSGRK